MLLERRVPAGNRRAVARKTRSICQGWRIEANRDRMSSFAVPQAGVVGERSAKHRFPCGAAGIAKGCAAAPLGPFTGEGTSYSTQRKVNGTLHQYKDNETFHQCKVNGTRSPHEQIATGYESPNPPATSSAYDARSHRCHDHSYAPSHTPYRAHPAHTVPPAYGRNRAPDYALPG